MSDPSTRREFLKSSVALVAGASLAGRSHARGMLAADASTPPLDVEWRNKQPEMRYRKLGRTGLMISEIVCGGDPIAPDNNRHVELAIELGLNYLDTSPAYGRGKSEEGYAQVIQGSKRDRVFVTTKIDPFSENRYQAYLEVFKGLGPSEQEAIIHEASEDLARRQLTLPDYMGNYFTGQVRQAEQNALANALEKRYGAKIDRQKVYAGTIIQSIEGSLRRLETDHVDLMLCPHGATSPAEVQIPEIYETFEKLRKEGKVRFLGVSSHSDPAGVLKAAAESGVYSMAMVAYNFINRHHLEPVIEEARRRDFGVIAMKTAQAAFFPDRSTKPYPERVALLEKLVPGEDGIHQKAYRWALSNSNLSAIISNMVDEKQVRENLAVART